MSLENYAEQVEILLLKGQTALAAMQVVREDENARAQIDRITVKASPRETELTGPDGVTPYVIRILVEVQIHLNTADAALMDSLITGVDAAQSSAVTSAITLATSAFPGGCFIRPLDNGTRANADNCRKFKRGYELVITIQNE